jgi:hypothetical protein
MQKTLLNSSKGMKNSSYRKVHDDIISSPGSGARGTRRTDICCDKLYMACWQLSSSAPGYCERHLYRTGHIVAQITRWKVELKRVRTARL